MRNDGTASRLTGDQGISIIEVLIAGAILAIMVSGLAILLSRGQEFVVGQGDTRVALHLAQQKLEKLGGLGFSAAFIGDRTNGDGVANGCAVANTNNEPCYNEVFSPANATPDGLGLGQQTAAGAAAPGVQTFTRLTCVRYVQDDNSNLPADPVEPPSAWTCPSCDPATAPMTCGATGTTTCCTQNTIRIKVAVIPTLRGSLDASTPLDPNRVTLESVLTPVPRP
jgi:type II secretory pathway pseudopilin PulG